MDTSSPPFIFVPSLPNLRDIGGYQTSSSPPRSVRQKLVFRSVDPAKCDETSIRKLRDELGISTIFDLRSKPEIDKNMNTEGDVTAWEKRLAHVSSDEKGTIERIWVPVFKEEDYGPEQVALRFQDYAREGTEGFVRAYQQILAHGVPSFAHILRHIASVDPSKPNQGILIHCTAGKDRTGVFTALLLSILGVDEETISHEYVLTEIGLKDLKPFFLERIMSNEAFQRPSGPGREGAERMVTCKKENMLATLAMMRREYGSPEEYVENVCGLNRGEVAAINKVMTVDGKGAAL